MPHDKKQGDCSSSRTEVAPFVGGNSVEGVYSTVDAMSDAHCLHEKRADTHTCTRVPSFKLLGVNRYGFVRYQDFDSDMFHSDLDVSHRPSVDECAANDGLHVCTA